MGRSLLSLMLVVAPAAPAVAQSPETVTFPSQDKLPITADRYAPHPDTAPLIVTFHQAGWSRGEYREIAPQLTAMGFNVLAVDQRAGEEVDGVTNETARAAVARGLGTDYLDAMPDLEAALRYARAHLAKGPVIAWGSSYSAALVLRLVGQKPGLADGVLAFSPGEYFADAAPVGAGARGLQVPIFITSARSEQGEWAGIYAAISSRAKRSYVPDSAGRHGSSTLWKSTAGHQGYWQAVRDFLDRNFPRPTRAH